MVDGLCVLLKRLAKQEEPVALWIKGFELLFDLWIDPPFGWRLKP